MVTLDACEPFITDVTCCPTWATLDPATQTQMIALASTMAWQMGKHREGVCHVDGLLIGYDYCHCNAWQCGISYPLPPNWYLADLRAQGPIQTVTEVLVNGVILDPTAWRLLNSRILARIDGFPWNPQRNLGGIVVSYDVGYPPSAMGIQAVEALACELGKLCSGLPSLCRFPVKPVAAGGSSTPNPDWSKLLEQNYTGVYLFDLWLSTLRIEPEAGVADALAPINYLVESFEGS